MVRNFRSPKVRVARPTRSCRKIAGPRESSRTAIAISGHNGAVTARASADRMKLMPRLAPPANRRR
jgi:hypothetical protein